MGSFNATCAVSHLPIQYGEKMRVLLMRVRDQAAVQGAYCYPADLLAPLMPPFEALYDDYGGFDALPAEDWGLFTRERVLQALKGNLLDPQKDLFESGHKIKANEWSFPDTVREYPLATLCVRSDIWDYLLKEHKGGTWENTDKTFEDLWPHLETYLRAQFVYREDALELAEGMWKHYQQYRFPPSYMFDTDVRPAEVSSLDEHAYFSGQGTDLYLATPPSIPSSGMPACVQEWMGHLLYDPVQLQRCWDDPAYLDRNIAGMRVLAEMVHVHLCMYRLRRVWMPQGGFGSSHGRYPEHLQFNRKIVQIAKPKARKKRY